MISKSEFKRLIVNLKVGQSTAEQDSILEDSLVETPIFLELLLDKVDLILGTKGSGKTALFFAYNQYLKEYLFQKKRIIVVSSVEAHGDPVFESYRKIFEGLSEEQFQNFWRVYLISLINRFVIEAKEFYFLKKDFPKEVKAFKDACRKSRLPLFEGKKTLREVVEGVLRYCKAMRWTPMFTDLAGFTYSLQLSSAAGEVDLVQQGPGPKTPVFLSDVHEKLLVLLRKANYKIWLMVDRLDEVFQRKSDVEIRALRALLQTSRSFHDPRVRLKLFLRDDIFRDLTEKGFAGLSHITDRMAPPMKWTEEDILWLIMKRISHSNVISRYFEIDPRQLDKSDRYREKIFYKLFPVQVESGPKKSWTIKWIYKRLSDGNGVVTPRDVIDLLRFARNKQEEIFINNPKDQKYLIGAEAFKKGLDLLSERKRDTYLYAEYPHLRKAFEAFTGKKSEYNLKSLKKILGEHALETAKYLSAVGFFQHLESTNTFVIAHLFRAGLKIKQGKAF